MKNKCIGLAKRNKQSKSEYNKVIESNYELGDEYYKEVEKKRKKMDKQN